MCPAMHVVTRMKKGVAVLNCLLKKRGHCDLCYKIYFTEGEKLGDPTLGKSFIGEVPFELVP